MHALIPLDLATKRLPDSAIGPDNCSPLFWLVDTLRTKMSRRLIYIWSALNFLYLCSGLLAIVFSLVLRLQTESGSSASLTLRKLILDNSDLDGALILGGMVLISWTISILAIVSTLGRRNSYHALYALNWSLVLVAVATITIGCAVWFTTLRPRAEFSHIWHTQPDVIQQQLQDYFGCCGYYNATIAGLFNAQTGFCADVANGQNTTAAPPCVGFIFQDDSFTLNNFFSAIFGYAAVETALFLATACIIDWRKELVRFELIDQHSKAPFWNPSFRAMKA